MIIGGLEKTTLIDYPGKVACTVFLAGCNFRCPYCYSSELVLPEKIKNQPEISEKYFFDFLKKRKGLLDGCVLLGGEPTINPDLPEFTAKIKDMGFLVKLDTNGSNPDMLEKMIDKKLIDYVAMDIKAPKEKYFEIIGVKIDLEEIEKSINVLRQGRVDYEFRTTLVPQILSREDILRIAKWISDNGRAKGVKYYIQNFMPQKTLDPKFEKITPYSDEYVKDIVKEIAPFFQDCQARF